MSENMHKSHNVSKFMYHFVFPTKYRRVVIDEEVDQVIKETCIKIRKRYEVDFLEIGTDKDCVHLIVQSVSKYSSVQIVKIVKSIIAKEVFARCPEVKKKYGEETPHPAFEGRKRAKKSSAVGGDVGAAHSA